MLRPSPFSRDSLCLKQCPPANCQLSTVFISMHIPQASSLPHPQGDSSPAAEVRMYRLRTSRRGAAPAGLIVRGLLGPNLLAHVLVSKSDDYVVFSVGSCMKSRKQSVASPLICAVRCAKPLLDDLHHWME